MKMSVPWDLLGEYLKVIVGKKKTIKNQELLTFSVGWRKFNSIPTLAIEDYHTRIRMLKYVPEHLHCIVVFWGPLCPINTGILCVKHNCSKSCGWRLLASGSSVVTQTPLRIVKKLKLIGTPFFVHRYSALIQGMFNTDLEASRFQGALVQTPSGNKGTIKQILGEPLNRSRYGSFRATFENRPLLSDIIFIRTCVSVTLPKFYDPITNLITSTKSDLQKIINEKETSCLKSCQHPFRLFTPASNFAGYKKEYIFKTGESGKGYYGEINNYDNTSLN